MRLRESSLERLLFGELDAALRGGGGDLRVVLGRLLPAEQHAGMHWDRLRSVRLRHRSLLL